MCDHMSMSHFLACMLSFYYVVAGRVKGIVVREAAALG